VVVMLLLPIRWKSVYVYMYKRPCRIHNDAAPLSHNLHPASALTRARSATYCFRDPLVAGRRWNRVFHRSRRLNHPSGLVTHLSRNRLINRIVS
jgi:hypothetical protein